MRYAVTGGGTGGHVYPVLAVVAALEAPPYSVPRDHIRYLGTRGRAEESLALRAGLSFTAVRAGAVQGRSPLGLLQSGFSILRGMAQAWAALGHPRPGAILATGGYVSVPVVLAGWLRGIPTLLYLPDVEPGLAVRFLSRVATKVAVTTSSPSPSLPPNKSVVTGYPVRPGFDQGDQAAAQQRFGLDPASKTLLVWGGSQGAHSINQEIARHLPQLLAQSQVVHICGEGDASWLTDQRDRLVERLRDRYHLYPYLYDGVADLMAAADLAVSRAGASVLGEFTVAGLPSVLVPYPYAGAHQRHNAAYLAEASAAVMLPEAHLSELVPLVIDLLKDEARLG
ncbi:MAG TPA: UDP-N-acetylglucosamine--N-acetylmuramyl-(pentapeptide) pyrophosphoryl-undecaprenol N-acetylglucosamine transferase, partial [Dehalococcoidia bacterium]|nr:UDP-N-acetylglucosamine--N-acetylmuramyl-(pentapeptide) pyrophosphoryl-undecaprenol N-acetylglucosamine transferase [Dehalococcoidia bacterium]